MLLEYSTVSFLPVEDAHRQPNPALLRAPNLVRVTYPRPTYPQRRALWTHYLDGHGATPDLDVTAVAGRFRLTGGQIRDAVLDARHRAAQGPPGKRTIDTDDLFAAARARTSDQLIALAKKVEPRHTWDDLVLPDDQLTQLREMCDQMRYRPIVLGEWGFDRKLSLGKGLNALFAGPSGTGKTMAAEVIARDLGLDLYKIDLSTVVSKYVGETEKNLERIFRAAHNSNAILFFDEADALFGKRSEVRDAHDRYANVEISYLLQKMEEYDGLVVLTSNLSKNMDEAFMRRMHFTVEFPYPEEDARRRIWGIVLPTEAPLAPNIDFCLLAERYRLTGGNIRNVALTAAFLAARDSEIIGMDHLLWATRREFQKMGRLASGREFEMEPSDD
jgi:SpoVK/Ycf46/Vps4 family AAA+-type ATPase